ncbi:hypothetical protein [Streptomyces paludis]|uniref:Uncharacterized protein n=1 Tax=Streptomyces paludis TaxID=2282738 RepID=A0A345HR05_9ACTN|nr:hypothetical protein [Streptomyces paludis]AXG79129.1 hypothetical protein DVK44_17230 [Streptomyces paludis]
MHAESYLALHHVHAAGLRAEAHAHSLAADAAAAGTPPRRPRGRGLRARLGWRLVEVGLRLATAPGAGAA